MTNIEYLTSKGKYGEFVEDVKELSLTEFEKKYGYNCDIEHILFWLDEEHKESKINEICIEAVEKFGEELQMLICIEEMSELTRALIRHQRYADESTIQSICEEIADVEIMLEQMRYIFDRNGKVERRKDERLIRLENMLDIHNEGIEIFKRATE